MNKNILVILYGVGIWALPFAVGMLLFPIQATHGDIFDTVMKLVLLLAVIFFTLKTMSTSQNVSLKRMVLIGFAWAVVCLAIDLPLFLLAFDWGLEQYLLDIPAGYLLIPLATGGMAKAHNNGSRRD